jgi:hypothetical protein
MNYRVKYKVMGYEKEFESPSYPEEDINSHLYDIAGYEGVYEAYIVPDTEDKDD